MQMSLLMRTRSPRPASKIRLTSSIRDWSVGFIFVSESMEKVDPKQSCPIVAPVSTTSFHHVAPLTWQMWIRPGSAPLPIRSSIAAPESRGGGPLCGP